jgi:hypothetical protein
MKRLLILIAISWSVDLRLAAEQTWTGAIADSLCGASHAMMSSQVTPPLSDVDCSKTCIDAGGKYVFVDGDKKVIAIANQNFAALKEEAGKKVKITGDLKNNEITISKIESAE